MMWIYIWSGKLFTLFFNWKKMIQQFAKYELILGGLTLPHICFCIFTQETFVKVYIPEYQQCLFWVVELKVFLKNYSTHVHPHSL